MTLRGIRRRIYSSRQRQPRRQKGGGGRARGKTHPLSLFTPTQHTTGGNLLNIYSNLNLSLSLSVVKTSFKLANQRERERKEHALRALLKRFEWKKRPLNFASRQETRDELKRSRERYEYSSLLSEECVKERILEREKGFKKRT